MHRQRGRSATSSTSRGSFEGVRLVLWKVVRGLCAAALFATVAAVPSATRIANAGSCWSWSAGEKKLARRTNSSRANHARGRLTLDPELSKVATVHAREMAKRNRLYHTPRETLGKRVTRWRRLGENVAKGDSIGAIHRAFMRSPSHRANVLETRYRHFGIGIRRAGGSLWVTVVFSARRDPGTTLSMPC